MQYTVSRRNDRFIYEDEDEESVKIIHPDVPSFAPSKRNLNQTVTGKEALTKYTSIVFKSRILYEYIVDLNTILASISGKRTVKIG
jgi:hypothetical protein